MFRHLLIALTGTARDETLIRYAASVARLAEATEASFVHVQGTAADGSGVPAHERVAEELSRSVEKGFGEAPEGVARSFHVLRGPLLDRLLSFAAERHTDLVLVGHRPSHRPGRRALIRRLAMKAPCSVWIVPDDASPGIRRILVPVDFSDHSADALEVATGVAARAGAVECTALHVYHTDAVLTYEESVLEVRDREKEVYQRFVAPIDLHGIAVTPAFVEAEDVPEAIHQAAQDRGADLKVMSTRGRSRSASILLGSVAESVIVEARTPLLAVKHFGARLGLLETLLDRGFSRGSPHFN